MDHCWEPSEETVLGPSPGRVLRPRRPPKPQYQMAILLENLDELPVPVLEWEENTPQPAFESVLSYCTMQTLREKTRADQDSEDGNERRNFNEVQDSSRERDTHHTTSEIHDLIGTITSDETVLANAATSIDTNKQTPLQERTVLNEGDEVNRADGIEEDITHLSKCGENPVREAESLANTNIEKKECELSKEQAKSLLEKLRRRNHNRSNRKRVREGKQVLEYSPQSLDIPIDPLRIQKAVERNRRQNKRARDRAKKRRKHLKLSSFSGGGE